MVLFPQSPESFGTSDDPAAGQPLPQPAADRSAQAAEVARALDEMVLLSDASDTDATWDAAFAAIDESRPHRPLFRGHD